MPTLGRCRIAFHTSIQPTQPNCTRSAQLGHPAPVTPSPNFKKKIVTPSPPPQPHRIQIQIATAGNRVWSAAASGRGDCGSGVERGAAVAEAWSVMAWRWLKRLEIKLRWHGAAQARRLRWRKLRRRQAAGRGRLAVAAAASSGMARRLVGIFEQLACGGCRGA